uniref:Uncharacterized protein n=1 Tax=Cyprinodon variegatus TaxID=28743 RepID=A0A3Q2DYS9_CYPVA
MEDSDCLPVTVEGNWSSVQSKTVKNKLLLYFQSKKKSGGGECRVEVEEEAPRASIFFKSEAVRERILVKEHHEIIVENHPLTLQLSFDPEGRPSQGLRMESFPSTLIKVTYYKAHVTTINHKNLINCWFILCLHFYSDSNLDPRAAVVLSNVSENLSKDLLQMLVESISGLDENDFSLVMRESNMAVVTFINPTGIHHNSKVPIFKKFAKM